MFKSVSKQSLSEVVFDQLRSRIVSRDLKAGDELPSERLLCELLQVNRGAVREAIKRLQQAGLVQVRHGGATTVLDYRAEAGLELLPSLLVDEQGRIQVEVARSIVRMRQIMTPAVAADAAERKSPEISDRLDAVVGRMRASENTGHLQHLVFEFWDVLVDGSGNIAYRLALNSLRKTYLHIWSLLTHVLERDFRDLDTYAQLARAVRGGERDTAFDLARVHIDTSSALINGFLDLYQQDAIANSGTDSKEKHRE